MSKIKYMAKNEFDDLTDYLLYDTNNPEKFTYYLTVYRDQRDRSVLMREVYDESQKLIREEIVDDPELMRKAFEAVIKFFQKT